MNHRLLAILLCASAAAGCRGAVEPAPVVGRWGGDHVSLVATESGGSLEYDCAHGTIRTPIRLDGLGRFQAGGHHVRGHGGPVRQDEVPDRHPAIYEGEVKGGTMRLRVQLPDLRQSLGPFVLRRDAEPRLLKCL